MSLCKDTSTDAESLDEIFSYSSKNCKLGDGNMKFNPGEEQHSDFKHQRIVIQPGRNSEQSVLF